MIVKSVLKKIKPSKKEEKELKRLVKDVVASAEAVVAGFDKHIKVRQVGSTAKGTWLRGLKDIDIFVLFPTESYAESELEEEAIPILHRICDALGVKAQLTYAQHPYLKFDYKGHSFELVPSFRLTKAQLESELASPVDRTPHHTDYVKKHLRKRDDVRLLKQFCRGIGSYGADMKHQGFSGYLCEILVIRYGSFLKVLKAAKDWKLGQVIKNCKGKEKWALVFADPVDKYRNVASAVAADKLELFVEAAEAYLKKPSLKFFFPKKPKKLASVASDKIYLYVFKKADELEDILYSQLRKFGRKAANEAKEKGFKVEMATAFVSGTKCVLLLKFENRQIDRYETVRGPPLEMHEFFKHSFKKKHDWKVFEKDGRLWAKKEREHRTPRAYLEELLDEAPSKLQTVGSLLHGKLASKFYKNGDEETKHFVTVALSGKRPWDW